MCCCYVLLKLAPHAPRRIHIEEKLRHSLDPSPCIPQTFLCMLEHHGRSCSQTNLPNRTCPQKTIFLNVNRANLYPLVAVARDFVSQHQCSRNCNHARGGSDMSVCYAGNSYKMDCFKHLQTKHHKFNPIRLGCLVTVVWRRAPRQRLRKPMLAVHHT